MGGTDETVPHCYRITMETAGLPLPGYHYIAPNHIVKAPIHWMGLRGQTSSVAYKISERAYFVQPQYGTLAPIYFFKWISRPNLYEMGSKSLDIVLNVCLHLLQVYKYFRYSYIYSPLYLINWDRNIRWYEVNHGNSRDVKMVFRGN